MEDKALLELCIEITGAFESGVPSYTSVTGNFDGMGLSAGILNWNAGQGTLQVLVHNIGMRMGWSRAQTFFKSDIQHFSILKPAEAIQWCLDHYIAEGTTQVASSAFSRWVNFLSQPESIAAQVEIATNTILARAKVLALKFCPDYSSSTRVVAFFFDLVTQSGGMQNQRGHVDLAKSPLDVSGIIDFARSNDLKCAAIWEAAVKNDSKTRLLLYYAYKRSQLSNPQYIWDACSRRGSIACRGGRVHEIVVDFTNLLD